MRFVHNTDQTRRRRLTSGRQWTYRTATHAVRLVVIRCQKVASLSTSLHDQRAGASADVLSQVRGTKSTRSNYAGYHEEVTRFQRLAIASKGIAVFPMLRPVQGLPMIPLLPIFSGQVFRASMHLHGKLHVFSEGVTCATVGGQRKRKNSDKNSPRFARISQT